MPKEKRKYPEGQWMSIGIAVGLVVGTAIYFIVDILTGEFGNLFFLGPSVGAGMGVAIGAGLEENFKKKGQIRKLTPQEQKTRMRLVTLGLVILVVGAIAGVLAFMAFL